MQKSTEFTKKLRPGKQPPTELKMRSLPVLHADLIPHAAPDTNIQGFLETPSCLSSPYILPQLPLPREAVRINNTVRINYILAEDSPEHGNNH